VAKTRHGRATHRQAARPTSGRIEGAGDFKDFKDIPRRLTRIEAALKKILLAVALPKPDSANRTRLLFPLVTNAAGFDTSFSVANTGRDSSGVVGKPGVCTLHYFGKLPNGDPPTRPSESTNRAVAVGETITFTLSSGGGLNIVGNAGFQGYLEVDCDFPFAHGWAFVADGPIGQARLGMTVPALVLPITRTNLREESVGQ
jgi:hypothetical protein